MSAIAVSPIFASSPFSLATSLQPSSVSGHAGSTEFSSLLTSGLQKVNDDVANAEKLSQAFALSDAVPVHQVTYALEQARLSVSLMVQVRNKLLDGYQQLMNMQI